MFSRHDLSDAHRDRIRHLLPGQPGGHGGAGNDTRLFVDAIRFPAKTGLTRIDLPTSAGKPNRPRVRYDRWCERGVWERIAAERRDDDTEWLAVDSSCVRARPCAAGAGKKAAAAGERPRRRAAGAADSARRSMPS